MFHPTETKPQNWRAVAAFEDGTECLLCLGRSNTHVRSCLAVALTDLLDRQERACLRAVCLEQWQGAADQGRWVRQGNVALPRTGPEGEGDVAPAPRPTPVRKKLARARAATRVA